MDLVFSPSFPCAIYYKLKRRINYLSRIHGKKNISWEQIRRCRKKKPLAMGVPICPLELYLFSIFLSQMRLSLWHFQEKQKKWIWALFSRKTYNPDYRCCPKFIRVAPPLPFWIILEKKWKCVTQINPKSESFWATPWQILSSLFFDSEGERGADIFGQHLYQFFTICKPPCWARLTLNRK